MITKSFKDWDSEEVETIFGIRRTKNLPLLLEWISTATPPPTNVLVEELKETLWDNADAWNEDELKMFFISPLINMIKFYHPPYYKAFTQRTLTIKTDTVDCKGDVEFLVATGRKNPKKPFFFLHEYKQEEKRNNDALGQLLIAMVAAQMENAKDAFPLYGCYVLGRFWFFVVLVSNEYSISRAFDATQDDLQEIIAILQKMKDKIEAYFATPVAE